MERPTPDAVQPPVTRWGLCWRLVGVARHQWHGLASIPAHWHGAWLAADSRSGWRVSSWCAGGVAGRCAIALVSGALSALSGLAAGPAVLAAVSLATRRVYWQVGVLALFTVAAGQVFTTMQPDDGTRGGSTSLINVVVTAAVSRAGACTSARAAS